MSRTIAVIPSRIGSVRFPRKPLALIAGVPLVVRVIRQVQKAKAFDEILVATDHPEIAELTAAEGARAVFTDSDLATGTDRVFQAVEKGFTDADPGTVVFNVQGDEPLIDPEALDQLAMRMHADPELGMGTIARRFQGGLDGRSEIENPMTAKVIIGKNNDAIYFSRHPIPFSRMDVNSVLVEGSLKALSLRYEDEWRDTVMKHIGVYAFRLGFLRQFCREPVSAIELTEGLEQLRALRMGRRIGVVEVTSDSWGVDTPEDVAKIEKRLEMLDRE